MASVKFSISGAPKPMPRARVTKRGTFNERSATKHKQDIGYIARDAFRKADTAAFTGPVALTCTFVFPWPQSVSEKAKRLAGSHHHVQRPDGDNLMKLVKDALNGIAYKDDSQVCQALFIKMWGVEPATHIMVEGLG